MDKYIEHDISNALGYLRIAFAGIVDTLLFNEMKEYKIPECLESFAKCYIKDRNLDNIVIVKEDEDNVYLKLKEYEL